VVEEEELDMVEKEVTVLLLLTVVEGEGEKEEVKVQLGMMRRPLREVQVEEVEMVVPLGPVRPMVLQEQLDRQPLTI
jgi:hypothetical protein